MSSDLLSSNDLVGLYSVDCAFLYYQPNHELHRKWLVLSAPYEARKGGWFEDDARGGAQGYLCVSMTLLGPGDTPVVHDDDDDEAPQANADGTITPLAPLALLMPPQMKQAR